MSDFENYARQSGDRRMFGRSRSRFYLGVLVVAGVLVVLASALFG